MRYFVGFLITLGLIILLIVLLFSGGGKPKDHTLPKPLSSYSTSDAQVSLTIDGPINAAQDHDQIEITVSKDNVTYQHLKGYSATSVDAKIFANDENSYDAFLHALEHAGFMSSDNREALKDEKGYCPTGNRYIFELNQDGNQLKRSWATSCGKPKTYLGSLSTTLTLFKKQVPGYSELTQGIHLN